jgi:putative FmdB family regulatory protein
MRRRYLAQAATGAVGSLALPMPFYEYRCPEGHVFERFQSMTAPAPEKCDACGATPVELVLYPIAIHYKGSGFYSTDYGKKGKAAAKKDGGSDSGSSSGDSSSGDSSSKSDSSAKSDSSSSTKTEKKSSSGD